MSPEEQIAELRELRLLLVYDRRALRAKHQSLMTENKRLREEKVALLKYIKELEFFNDLNK